MANPNLTPEERADLEAKRKKLFNAYTSGTQSISHNGKTVTFRSLSDIKEAINAIDAELGKKRTRIIKTVSKRGLA